MKWFIVVVMIVSPNSLDTPLWIPYISFDNQQKCFSYVQEHHQSIYAGAVKQYENLLMPNSIYCVEKDKLKNIFGHKPTPKKEHI